MKRIISVFLCFSIISGFSTCFAAEGSKVQNESTLTTDHIFVENFVDTSAVHVSQNNTISDSGTCGDGLTWSLSNGVLTISGNGRMEQDSWAWREYCNSIHTITINNGVENISAHAFIECSYVQCITIPTSVLEVGDRAFVGCVCLTDIYFGGTKAEWTSLHVSFDSVRPNIHCAAEPAFEGDDNKLLSSGNCGISGNNLQWSLYESGRLVITGSGGMANYEGASGIDGNGNNVFTSTAPWVLWYRNNGEENRISSVYVGDGVTSIGDTAFYICESLESVRLPDSITSIGEVAFKGCSRLTGLVLPQNVETLGPNAFMLCTSLRSLTIPSAVREMGLYAFGGCVSLTNVIIESGTSIIGDDAFCQCTNITNISVPGSVLSIGAYAFSSCFKLETVELSEGVKSIGQAAFYNCKNLKNITLPQSLETLSISAFQRCQSLLSINIPASVKQIGGYAFEYCVNLTNVEIAEGVEEIGPSAFQDCDLQSITLPESMEKIRDSAFRSNNNILSVTIPSRVTQIGARAFDTGNLRSYVVDENNTAYCSVEGVLFSKDLTALYSYPSMKNETHYCIPNGVTMISEFAFSTPWALKSLVIPYGVRVLASNTFSSCYRLTELTIPISVRSIGSYAFPYTLEDIYYAGDELRWRSIASAYDDSQITIHYNWGNSNVYKEVVLVDSGILQSSGDWKLMWEYTAPKDISNVLGYGTLTIRLVGTIPDWYDSVDLLYNGGTNYPWLSSSKVQSSKIKTINIYGASGMTVSIPANSFQGYKNLETVKLGHVYYIGESAFSGNAKLRSVELNDVVSLHSKCFAGTDIRVITLDRSVYDIAHDSLPQDNDVLIRCYLNSSAQRFAVEHNFRFRLLDTTPSNTVFYGEGEQITFGVNLDTTVLQTSSSTYNPHLSYMLMALSYAAYNENNIKKSYQALDFTTGDFQTFSYYPDPNDSRYGKDNVAYTFGRKTMANGETLVLITIRGSYGEFMQSSDWWSDFNITNVSGRHTGFETAKVKVYNALWSWLGGIPKTGVRYVITGHSRGAAVSNLLALQLSDDGVSKNNVYAYNFACPDVAIASVFDFNWLGNHDNIFNLCRREDPITLIPSVLCNGTALPTLYWGKFGQTLWFSDSKSYVLDINSHSQDLYLDFTSRRLSLANFFETPGDISQDILRNMWGFFTAILCPVDVEVTDRDGNVIAAVRNGQIEYSGSEVPTNMFILIDGEEKYVFIPGNADYKVNLVGTDIGTMTYAVYEANMLSGEVKESATYSNVRLENGKEMTSQVGTTTEVRNVSLFVDDGNPDNVQIISSVGEETNHSHSFSWMPFKSNGEVASVIDYSFSCDCGYVSPGTDRFSIIYDAVTEQLSADSDIPGGFNVVIGLYDGQNKFIGTIFLSESQPTAAVPENATTIRVFLLDSENYSPKAVSVRLK